MTGSQTPSAPPADTGTRDNKFDALEEFVAKAATARQAAYARDNPAAVRELAILRRAVGTAIGARPDATTLVLEVMPDALSDPGSRDEYRGVPTPWEQAAYDALTLHAWHQQSRREEPMHHQGRRFGAAIHTLGDRSPSTDAVRARFHLLGAASSHHARVVHLRGLIAQLRAYRIPLDYGQLAVDLRRLEYRDSAPRVLLSWSRDYHHATPATTRTPSTGDADTTTGDDA